MTYIRRYLEKCMTVGELQAELNRFDPKSPVLFAHTAKDHWRSPIAERIEEVGESDVFFTEYHGCAQEFGMFEVSNKKDEDVLTVVVVR